jgi:FlaA1/EpsC-like NDP-sugar epimerase
VDFWHSWFLDLPVWVTPTFSLLSLSRTYVTVWTRARILDVLMLLFTLQAGLILSLGIALMIDPYSARESLLRALVLASVAHAGIIGIRIVYRCTEEIVLYLKSQRDASVNRKRVVLYGAGGKCQLFLKERGFNNSSTFDDRTIIGLIDDEPALHFKWVYGHRVIGGGKDLPRLVKSHRITGIIVTATLKAEALAAIQELAAAQDLELIQWSVETKILTNGSADPLDQNLQFEPITRLQ